MSYYKQVMLTKGKTSQVVWIPESFAIMNNHVRIKDDDGWKVTLVGSNRMPADYLLERSRDYLRTRQASDI